MEWRNRINLSLLKMVEIDDTIGIIEYKKASKNEMTDLKVEIGLIKERLIKLETKEII